MAVNLFEERGNFFLVHVYLRYGIHSLVQLLAAYFLSRGQRSVYKFLLDNLLDGAHLRAFARVDDADRGSFFAGTPCSSAAVGVTLDVVWQSVVNNMRQVVNVQSTCGHIGGHQELHVVVAELLHGEVALLLT